MNNLSKIEHRNIENIEISTYLPKNFKNTFQLDIRKNIKILMHEKGWNGQFLPALF